VAVANQVDDGLGHGWMVAAAPAAQAPPPGSAYAARMSHPTDRPPPEVPTRPGFIPRTPVPGTRPPWALPAALLVTAAVYPLAFRLRAVPFRPAMVALAVVWWWAAWHPYLRVRLRPSGRLVAAGVVTGLGLYALTCAGAAVVRGTPWWPGVQEATALARGGISPAVAALLVAAVVAPAEEVLWRGAVFARATRWLGGGWRPVAATTALDAVVVGLSGYPVLALAALACGAVWARQRQVTGSLVPGVVAHALWALLVVAYLPGNQ
jgi:membrane protease YdiL (CAAX protease family)